MLQGSERLPQLTEFTVAQFTAATGAGAALVYDAFAGPTVVYVKADNANSGTVRIGSSADTCFWDLAAGESLPGPLVLNNLALLFALGSAASQKLNVFIQK